MKSLSLAIAVTVVLFGTAALAAGVQVNSANLTTSIVTTTAAIPTNTPTATATPTPVLPGNTLLLDHLGTMVTAPPAAGQRSVAALSTVTWRASASLVATASNASNWTLTFVSNGQPAIAAGALVVVRVYWHSGSTCSAAVAGRIFAQTSAAGVLVTQKSDLQGYSITVPAVAGTVNHTFTTGQILCVSVQNLGTGTVGMRGGTNSTTGVTGMSRISGALTRR